MTGQSGAGQLESGIYLIAPFRPQNEAVRTSAEWSHRPKVSTKHVRKLSHQDRACVDMDGGKANYP